MNSDRTLKRLAQMQKRKESLNEMNPMNIENNNNILDNSLNKKSLDLKNLSGNILDKNIYSSSENQMELNLLSFDIENDNEIKEEESEKNNGDENISELDFNINNSINFENENSTNNNNNNENEVEVNISNLDCEIDGENNNNEIEINYSSNEFAKNFLNSNSKSFISFNNNLVFKAAVQKEKNTPSYIFALCPELLNNKNKEIISENYAVKDTIKEENENEISNQKSIKSNYQFNNNSDNMFERNNNNNNLNNSFIQNNLSIDLSDLLINSNKTLLKRKTHNKSNSFYSDFNSYSNFEKNMNNNNKDIIIHNKTLSNNFKISNRRLKLLSMSSKGFHSRQISLMNPIVEFKYKGKKKEITSKYYHKFRMKLSNSNFGYDNFIHHMKSKTSFFSPSENLIKIF